MSNKLLRTRYRVQALDNLPKARGVLVTGGGDGCAFAFRGPEGKVFSGSVPVYEVQVQDTTGAGDAFTCGLMAFLLAEVRTYSFRAQTCRPGVLLEPMN